jgi:hypothetical protein
MQSATLSDQCQRPSSAVWSFSLAATLLAGERITADFGLYAQAAVAGAVAGALIGHRFLSEHATRGVPAAILAGVGLKLLLQWA